MDLNQIAPFLSGLGLTPGGIAIGMAILYAIQWFLNRNKPAPAPAPGPNPDPAPAPVPDKGPLGLGLLDLLKQILPLLLARKAAGQVRPYSAESVVDPTVEDLYLEHVRKLLNE